MESKAHWYMHGPTQSGDGILQHDIRIAKRIEIEVMHYELQCGCTMSCSVGAYNIATRFVGCSERRNILLGAYYLTSVSKWIDGCCNDVAQLLVVGRPYTPSEISSISRLVD
jgi:hypothetical protein